jgi:hypothetical protein
MEQALSYDCRVHFYGAGKLIRISFEIPSLAGMCGNDCSSADSAPCLHPFTDKAVSSEENGYFAAFHILFTCNSQSRPRAV